MKPTLVLCLILFILSGCKHDDFPAGAYLKPLSLSAEPLPDGVSLKWSPVFQFEEGMYSSEKPVTPAQYELYIAENTDQDFKRVAVIDGNVYEYVVKNQPEGKTIYAQVKAIHPKLTTSQSNIATTNVGQMGKAELLFPVNTPYIYYGAWGGSNLVYTGIDGNLLLQPGGTIRKLKGVGLPVLSPDGKYAAFRSTVNSNTSYTTQLFIETVETGAMRLVDTQQAIFSVEWSNDGQSLAYIGYAQGERTSIWKRSLTEDKPVRLYTPSIGPNQLQDGQIDWSADDSYIVFAQERGFISGYGRANNVMKIPANGGEPQTLLASNWWDEQPAFSPDGQRLAFISNRSGFKAVWLMSLKTGKLQQVTGIGDDFYYINRLDWMSDSQLTFTGRVPSPINLSLKKVTLP